ncbi:MAG TPA: ferritin-like domain-containing protein [Candidatus Hydrogenedentes bacterium]|jgi:ferritin-like protein|nr:ferritin [Candidatus Hydrogenedentota bacterium]MDY0030668.1 ferritin-like domain-containing protein [FCB group bacterium]NLT61995.1 ferritin [Candidatus Hydrogenedentota bacterium]HNZ18515.1 ferritin-like domain-containing protein [Candidatus Hydrogenedentota bacterium]HOH33829.1 ferritin-like domain-containing protein [Candidatus Hydrogenedentota bacterium]
MSTTYHEPFDSLSEDARNIHRALASVIEELEAVDWYHQRAECTNDPELKEIVLHNRDEELEHAAMGLEWLRRRMPALDAHLRTYLFTSENILAVEESAEGGESGSGESTASGGDLGIGSGKGGK